MWLRRPAIRAAVQYQAWLRHKLGHQRGGQLPAIRTEGLAGIRRHCVAIHCRLHTKGHANGGCRKCTSSLQMGTSPIRRRGGEGERQARGLQLCRCFHSKLLTFASLHMLVCISLVLMLRLCSYHTSSSSKSSVAFSLSTSSR